MMYRPPTWIIMKMDERKDVHRFLEAIGKLDAVRIVKDGCRWIRPRTITYRSLNHFGKWTERVHVIDYTALVINVYLRVEGLSVASYERSGLYNYHYKTHIALYKHEREPFSYFGLPETIRIIELNKQNPDIL